MPTIRCCNIKHRDHVKAQSDLIEEGELQCREPGCCKKVHEVIVVVAEKWKTQSYQQNIDAMSRGALPC